MTLCLIPARGGSKRIPRKNVRTFAGRPMIAWSIAAAREAGVFDRLVVSTDDPGIAEVARAEDAEVLHRPAELADDHATTAAVVRHGIEQAGQGHDAVCCLYATAPFVRAADIRAGLPMLDRAAFAVPVTSFPFPIQRAVRITGEDRLEMMHPEHLNTRSQDLEEAWHDAGQFYWGRVTAWTEGTPLFGSRTMPIRLPRWRVQDIDTEEDWRRAEAMFQALVASGA
ncbi:N-acylneuraminate cytidylyltransferase [Tranquillimonas rosea]|uniref:N-acylneuraminate cytidylyltransferase n=1 Tax=Tranquillimonas rosea TaxID=641238 RepID=A0A1H9UXQ8_9RHOB|nr:pseudaminic acid cytidylyltransferase [Tranquillimonas rosea]SES14330.1 N-acylneuraminate cytidylyltransferase [Tranquillimonas rosea]